MISTTYVVDEEKKILGHNTDMMEFKSEEDTITGYLATRGTDKNNDRFTEEALKSFAEQIRKDVELIKVKYQDFDEEALDEVKQYDGSMGNIDHNNHPKVFPIGDIRTVPAFRIKSVAYDGFGVKVKAKLATNAHPPDISDAIKTAVKEDFLNAMSVEFIVKEAEKNADGVRVIKSAIVNGAAMTGRPIQPRAKLTDFDIKSFVKADTMSAKNVASVKFKGTREGKLDESRIDKEENNLSDHYLFGEGENKEDYSYPVVDADMYLRRGNVEAAYQLGARDVSESELESKLKKLNEQFENPPIEFEEEKSETIKDLDVGEVAALIAEKHNTSQEDVIDAISDVKGVDLKSNVTTEDDNMSEDKEPKKPEQKSEPEDEGEDEALKEEMAEIKSAVENLKEENEKLKEENEELKAKIEDREEIKAVKNGIEEIKEEVKGLEPEDQPKEQKDPEDPDEDEEVKARLQKVAEVVGKDHVLEKKGIWADKLDIDEDEVENYV